MVKRSVLERAVTYSPKGNISSKVDCNAAANIGSAPEPITLEKRLEHVKILLKDPEADPQQLFKHLDYFINEDNLVGLRDDQITNVENVVNDIVEKLISLNSPEIIKELELRKRYLISKHNDAVANKNHTPTKNYTPALTAEAV